MKLFSQTHFTVLVLPIVLLKNQDHKPDYTGMRISILPSSQLVFTAMELTTLQRILQISA